MRTTLTHTHTYSKYKIYLEIDEDATITEMHDAWVQFLLAVGYDSKTVEDFYR